MNHLCRCETCKGNCFDIHQICQDCVNHEIGECMWCSSCNKVCNMEGPCKKEEESEEISELPDLETGQSKRNDSFSASRKNDQYFESMRSKNDLGRRLRRLPHSHFENFQGKFSKNDYLSWDQYFMGIAMLSAQRSKDPSTQVGACIVNSDKKIVGIGYNGFPIGIPDDALPWGKTGEPLDTKYLYVCHSELNAILNSTQNLKGCTLYVSLFPCNECAKTIIQSGIKKVIYADDKHSSTDIVKASKRMLNLAGIHCVEYNPANRQIIVKL